MYTFVEGDHGGHHAGAMDPAEGAICGAVKADVVAHEPQSPHARSVSIDALQAILHAVDNTQHSVTEHCL